MADYEQTPDVKKRLRYYDNQFLLEQDFIDEQKYHIDRQRWHDRHLHVAGVVAGLDVKKTGTAEVTVEPGTAVDSLGRHILLSKKQPVELADSSEKRLYLRFHEVESDKALDEGASGATRFCQEPQLFFPKNGDTVAADWVLLAEVKGTGTTIQSVDTSVRQYAGVRLPGPEGKDAGFLRYFADAGSLATLRLGAGNDSRDSLRLYQGGEDRLVIQNGNVDIPSVLRVGSGTFSYSAQVAIKASSASGDMLSLEKANGYQMLRVDNNGEVSIDRLSVSTMLRMGSGSFSHSAQVAIKADSSSGNMLSLEKADGTQMLRMGNNGEVSIDRLTVSTSLKFTNADVMRSSEVVRTIRGSVSLDKVNNISHTPPLTGKGWKAYAVGDKSSGYYEIEFDPPFRDPRLYWGHDITPSVVVTVARGATGSLDNLVTSINYGQDGLENFKSKFDHVKTTDNAVVLGVSHSHVLIKTGDKDGNAAPRSFHFIVVGIEP